MIQEAAHPEAHIIFGANVDDTLDEQIWVTVIATRFDARGRRADGTSTGVSRDRRPALGPARRRRTAPAPGACRATRRSRASSASTSPSSSRTSRRAAMP